MPATSPDRLRRPRLTIEFSPTSIRYRVHPSRGRAPTALDLAIVCTKHQVNVDYLSKITTGDPGDRGYGASMEVRAELTVEPFIEGAPGDHVLAAIEALSSAEPDIGPFATTISGDLDSVGELIRDAVVAAFCHGATGATVTFHRTTALSPDGREFAEALRPVLRSLGLRFTDLNQAGLHDIPIEWRGEKVGAVAPIVADPGLHDPLPRLIQRVESDFGQPLAGLERAQKQQAVRSLERLGAFTLRNAVDEIADAFAVSRATLYNYLRANREER